MNEQAIQDAYNLFVQTGYKGDINAFSNLIKTNPNALNDSYNLFTENGYNGGYDDYKTLVGVNQAQGADLLKKKGRGTMAQMVPQTITESFVEESLSASQPKQPVAKKAQPQPKQKAGILAQPVPKTTTESFLAATSVEPSTQPTEVKPKVAEKPKEDGQGWLLNTVSALDKGFYKNLIGSPIKALGTGLQFVSGKLTGTSGKAFLSDALINFGNYFNNAIDELAPQDEEFKNSLSDQFAQAFGQVASQIVTGGATTVGKGAALAPEVLSKGVATTNVLKELGSGLVNPASVSSGLVMGQSEFDRAKAAGATDDQAFEAFYKNAAVGSVLERIPVMQFMKRFNKASQGGLVDFIKTKGVAGTVGGLEEMSTEVLQQLYANKTAQEIYDINQDLFEGVGTSGGIGFGVGFLLNAMGANARLLKKSGNVQEAQLLENQIVELEQQAKNGGPSSYKMNGIKIESADIIDKLIDSMTADDLAKANIEITNDPALKVKLQDKIVTSSIKEQVRKANPELNEPSLNAITQLELDLQKIQGNTTQSGKDKAAAIRSQIKNIQENQLQEEAAVETLNAEQDAIQKQTAGQVPVQSETGTRLQVAEGEPQAEPQGVTQEVETEEVKTLRAQEQTELLEAIPNAENYVVDGKVDRTKISDPNDLKTFDEIYEKYDKLITPLLPTTEVSLKTPTEVAPELNTVESTTKALETISKKDPSKVEKILGEDIVYHGTKEDFDEFDENKIGATDDGWFGRGFYFHSDRDRGGYGDIVKAAKIDLKNPIVLPVENSGQYLYDIVGKEANLDESFRDEGSQNIIREIGSDNFTKIAKKLGYDGVIVNYAQGTQEIVAFDKNSIKQSNPKTISEAYHQAKKDNSNPELVKSVESLLTTETQQNEQAPSTTPQSGPVAGNRLFNNPIAAVSDIAKRYYKRVFKKDKPDYFGSRQFDEARAKRISDAFIAMQHEPNNPQVKKAYEALAKETLEQYKAFLEAGYRVEINNEEPYANSQEMIDDLRNNKRIKIFSTESGFGDNPITPKQRKENPLLKESGFKDVNGQPLLINDAFRAIHDFFGHAELGNSFGFKGEENAWNVHARMFSPLARRAMTTETRGQNSYVNFSGVNQEIDAMREQARKLRSEGKEAEAQAIAEKIYELGSFADQKIGLLPEEFSEIDVNDIGDVNLQPQGLQSRDVEVAPVVEQAPVEEVTVEEEEQFVPLTVSDIEFDTRFSKDEASNVEEDEREGDNGRYYVYISEVETPVFDVDGEQIGYLVKMVDDDRNLTFEARDEDGNDLSKNEERFDTLGEARQAFIDNYNKVKKKEFDKEAKAKAKEKAKQAEKAAKKAAKAAAKEGPAQVETVVEELLDVDVSQKDGLDKVYGFLDSLDNNIKKELKKGLNDATFAIPLGIVQQIVKGLKVLVKGGMTLRDAIRSMSKETDVPQETIKDIIAISPIQDEFNALMAKVDTLIARQKSKNIPDVKIVSNVDTFIRNSDVYKAADDAQKKILEREGRVKMNARERRAPSIGRVLGALKDFTNISRQEKIQIIKQIRNLSKDAASNLAKEIREMRTVGKITVNQATNIIAKFGKVNLLNERSIGSFVDYMSKVFNDAEYASKLSEANRVKKDISKLSKNKDKNANLRDMAKEFIKINPSMVEDIDAYNDMAFKIKEAIKGSTIRAERVTFASTVDIKNASEYINKTLAVQNEAIRQQKAEEIQELMGIDASKLSYEDMMSLLDSTEPITKYNEGIIRSTINKMFDTYSSIIKQTLSTGKDQFTDEDVEFTKNQKDLVRRFMDMDLSLLKPKEALQAVDALNNFLNNKSTAKMEAVLSDYTGRKNAAIVKGKKIAAQPLTKYWSKALGRFLGEQTTNLNVLFERMFKGVTRGGFVEDMSGVTLLKNKKAFAETQSNNIVNDYVNQFYKSKANGEAFNTDYNNTERGIASFMMRNVIGSEAEMQAEFNRRKKLIEQSIDELSEGNDIEQKKAELYQKAYDKVVKDSKNISDIRKKTDPKNAEAIDWWTNQWSDKYEQLSDVSENVYNKVLDKDLNYIPDRFANLSMETGTVELSNDESAFHRNNGTIYKKETGVLMAATKPSKLPSNTNGDTSMYIDLSFDKTNSNAMYDALVDINTAAPIRQVESFLNSRDFKSIVPQAEDAKILKDRINLYVRNIRNKNPYTNDELSATVRRLNKIAAVGVGQALGGILQPVKQVVPVAMNTLFNGGGLDIMSQFNQAKTNFLNNSGYAIANRGLESQAQIESINKLIDLAAQSKGAKAIELLEKANKKWLEIFLVKPDVFVARASWMTYYEQSLKKQGINPKGIDYNTHELNEQAGNYAQRMVDRQQNVSDADLAGKLFANKESSNQILVKMLMAFASFRMNQSARLGSDLAVMTDDTATEEDKTIAARSLSGYAVEAIMFRVISGASIIALGSLTKLAMGLDEDDDEFDKRVNNVVKGQMTSVTTDLFSPLPIVDKGVQFGVNTALEQVQNALQISKEKQVNIYGVSKQSALQNLGMFGITGERALQLIELANLAYTGTYTDDFGNTKKISEDGQKALKLMIAPALLTNVGLLPTEFNSVVRNAVKFSKKKYKSAEDKAEEAERAEETAETKEQKIRTLEDIRKFTDDPDEINAINREIYELSADDEQKAIIKEERKKERRAKETLLTDPETGVEYDNESDMKKYNPRLYNENFGPESQWYKDHKWEREIEKKMNKQMREAEEEEFNYTAPSKRSRSSSGFGPQKGGSKSGFGPQKRKSKSGFGPQ
jgi:hypothetical protein